jgi:hypothetical protein
MTKRIRLLVRILLTIILISGWFLAKRAFAADQEDYQTLSRQYNLLYADLLTKKINALSSGSHVVLYFKEGTQIEGTYTGFSEYDDSVWILEKGHWLSDAYSVMDLQDISISVVKPI